MTVLYFELYRFSAVMYFSYPRMLRECSTSSPEIVFRFSPMHFVQASLVIKEMNSETHSWMISLASFEILALSGRACFMILEMLAIGRNLDLRRCTFQTPPHPPLHLVLYPLIRNFCFSYSYSWSRAFSLSKLISSIGASRYSSICWIVSIAL